MKIVVCVKQAAVLAGGVVLTADERDVDRDVLDVALDECDAYAIEEALRIRDDAGGGEVVVATAGDEDAEIEMRQALAMGADRGVRVWSEALRGADPIAVARALAPAVAEESPDLVLAGARSSDAAHGATGIALAELLGLPRAAVCTRVELADGRATVHRELEDGLAGVTDVTLPALLTIQPGAGAPRLATLRALARAEEKPIAVVEPGDLGPPAARVRRMFAPPRVGRREMLGSDAREVARRIKELVAERLQ